ncbi:MAG TPA: SDR family oxidoreductase [Mycobacteriales bacterium]|nr:SDR family oxidoreductase [Mycobacteriales bacterium]
MSRRVVFITGASGGVGRGIAESCAQAGWTVWIGARRTSEGEAVAAAIRAAGGDARFAHCDVGVAESVRSVIQEIADASGRLDGVVHNATSGLSAVPVEFTTMPVADLRDHVIVTLRGALNLAREGFELVRESSGSYVFLTSEAGFEGKARLAPYAMVKGAVRGLIRSLAREWGPSDVRVNGVAPLADSEAMVRAFDLDPQMESRVLGRIPLRRLGDAAADIGPVVRFLLSDDARFVTGTTIMADGGSCQIT